jgi:hypothetical protein
MRLPLVGSDYCFFVERGSARRDFEPNPRSESEKFAALAVVERLQATKPEALDIHVGARDHVAGGRNSGRRYVTQVRTTTMHHRRLYAIALPPPNP